MVMSKVLQRTKTRKSISVKEIAAGSRRSDLNPNPQKIAFFRYASPCAAPATGSFSPPHLGAASHVARTQHSQHPKLFLGSGG